MSDFEFSPNQMVQIGEHAIAYTRRHKYLPFDADAWIQNAYDNGLFPASINERLKQYVD